MTFAAECPRPAPAGAAPSQRFFWEVHHVG